MIRLFFLFILLIPGILHAEEELKKTAFKLPQNPAEFEYIRISLLTGKPEVLLATDAPYRVLDSQKRDLFSGVKFQPTSVRASASGIQIGRQFFSDNPITLLSDEGAVKMDEKAYRHAVQIWRDSSKSLSIINEIPLEDYLKGVLPREASPKWPFEALKAQAVAARTYAFFKAIENKNNRYVLSKDVLSQVYGGQSAESSSTSRAVEATRHQILTYDGKVFPAYFHSTCGGATTRAEYLWKVEPHPALEGVKCNFCHDSKHYSWSADFNRQDIEAKLRPHGIKISPIKKIEPTELDGTGRAKYFVVSGPNGKAKIHSNDFRLWLDPMKLKSNRILSVDSKGESFHFSGRGWGHGVGLCQYGMKQLAELGYSYSDILKYYYSGAQIRKVQDGAGTASPSSWISKAVSFVTGEE